MTTLRQNDPPEQNSPLDSPLEFRVTRPGHPRRRLKLIGPNYTFGRGFNCSVRLDDASVRPVHASLTRKPDGRVVLRAAGSAILVNARPQASVDLQLGDNFQLGEFTFELLTPTAPPEAATAPDATTASPETISPQRTGEEVLAQINDLDHLVSKEQSSAEGLALTSTSEVDAPNARPEVSREATQLAQPTNTSAVAPAAPAQAPAGPAQTPAANEQTPADNDDSAGTADQDGDHMVRHRVSFADAMKLVPISHDALPLVTPLTAGFLQGDAQHLPRPQSGGRREVASASGPEFPQAPSDSLSSVNASATHVEFVNAPQTHSGTTQPDTTEQIPLQNAELVLATRQQSAELVEQHKALLANERNWQKRLKRQQEKFRNSQARSKAQIDALKSTQQETLERAGHAESEVRQVREQLAELTGRVQALSTTAIPGIEQRLTQQIDATTFVNEQHFGLTEALRKRFETVQSTVTEVQVAVQHMRGETRQIRQVSAHNSDQQSAQAQITSRLEQTLEKFASEFAQQRTVDAASITDLHENVQATRAQLASLESSIRDTQNASQGISTLVSQLQSSLAQLENTAQQNDAAQQQAVAQQHETLSHIETLRQAFSANNERLAKLHNEHEQKSSQLEAQCQLLREQLQASEKAVEQVLATAAQALETVAAQQTQLPTSELPTSELPTSELPTSELPTSELPTSQLPTNQLPTNQLPADPLEAVEFPAPPASPATPLTSCDATDHAPNHTADAHVTEVDPQNADLSGGCDQIVSVEFDETHNEIPSGNLDDPLDSAATANQQDADEHTVFNESLDQESFQLEDDSDLYHETTPEAHTFSTEPSNDRLVDEPQAHDLPPTSMADPAEQSSPEESPQQDPFHAPITPLEVHDSADAGAEISVDAGAGTIVWDSETRIDTMAAVQPLGGAKESNEFDLASPEPPAQSTIPTAKSTESAGETPANEEAEAASTSGASNNFGAVLEDYPAPLDDQEAIAQTDDAQSGHNFASPSPADSLSNISDEFGHDVSNDFGHDVFLQDPAEVATDVSQFAANDFGTGCSEPYDNEVDDHETGVSENARDTPGNDQPSGPRSAADILASMGMSIPGDELGDQSEFDHGEQPRAAAHDPFYANPSDAEDESFSPPADATPNPATSSDESLVAESPAVAGPQGSAAPQDTSDDASEDDESIEAYMNRLLKRVQGQPGNDGATDDATDEVDTTNVVTETSSYAPASVTATIEPADSTVMLDEPFQALDFNSTAELKPRSRAPEREANLAAMRALANSSARTAIASSRRRELVQEALFKLAVAAGGIITGFILLAATGFETGRWMVMAMCCVGLGLFFLFEAYQLRGQLAQANASLNDQEPESDVNAAVANSPHGDAQYSSAHELPELNTEVLDPMPVSPRNGAEEVSNSKRTDSLSNAATTPMTACPPDPTQPVTLDNLPAYADSMATPEAADSDRVQDPQSAEAMLNEALSQTPHGYDDDELNANFHSLTVDGSQGSTGEDFTQDVPSISETYVAEDCKQQDSDDFFAATEVSPLADLPDASPQDDIENTANLDLPPTAPEHDEFPESNDREPPR